MQVLEIDGAYGEGGGQLARTATGLSAVTGRPIRIKNIRANRPQPGLKRQHLKGIEAVARLCNAKVTGLSEGSTRIEFIPGKLSHEHLRIDVGTAGSITLVLQSLMISAVHTDRPVEFEIIGGTDVKWSPSFSYFESVFCGNLKRMGIEIETKALKAGFFPKGGGRVHVRVMPCQGIAPLNCTERGNIKRTDCWSFSSRHLEKAEVAERQMRGFEELFERVDCRDVKYVDSLSPGSSITAHAHCNTILGASGLGERGKRAEDVGRECAELLKKQLDSQACLDRWMADQVLAFMALSGKPCRVSVAELTNHAKTSMWLIEKFLPVKFRTSESGRHFIISSEPL